MLKVDINIKDAAPKVADATALLKDGRPLFERISQALESVVEANFEAQGRPAWVPLAKSTVAARTKGKGGSLLKILQDTGTLASSISTESRDTPARCSRFLLHRQDARRTAARLPYNPPAARGWRNR